ncbi:nodulation protein NfeD [Undibacterium arcticum]|uniref:Nodulation protein NfeD n=1 Tax=Undibacterium arcticum TaxID=1762892 RepID=A0ABV7EYH4_9BURK
MVMLCFGFFLKMVIAAPIVVIPLAGAIGPASADFVGRGIARADKDGAQLVVLRIDTPGGLDLSMRQIIQTILASPVPVVGFVAPSGARAASAGTYILYASHVAAMAPGTNLGAASPVRIGMPDPMTPERPQKPGDASGPDHQASAPSAPDLKSDTQSTLTRKQMHDAAAYIRGLAQLRGRNAEWAERAVREAVSLSADEALAQKVIDLTARDVPELLIKLNGRKVATANGEHVLHTAGAKLVTLEPDWRNKFLTTITDPSIAVILMMVGIYGLIFEFSNPGFVLPGVVGAICLLLAAFALQMLPVNYAGLALILLGAGFITAEAFLPSFGVIGIGGIIAFAFGMLILIDTDLPGFGIPLSLIAVLSGVTALFIFFVSGIVLKARRRPVVSGQEALLGSAGLMLSTLQPDVADGEGWARVHSEQWRVRSTVPLQQGQPVRVIARNGLVLMVVPIIEQGK